MHSQWLAFTPGVDPRERARQLRQSWERLLAGRELKAEPTPGPAAEMRGAIVDSWKRSLDTGLDPVDLLAPLEADPPEMRERWAEHPLGSLAHVLHDQLKNIARDSQSLIVVGDASGLLLHIEGPDTLRERAAEMNFVEGAQYSEAAAGTNGIGTTLAADHALQVFASEHFNQRHHGWTCSGAPVHDPVSRRVLGVIDLSTPWETVHPLSLELATTAARALEQCLADARRLNDARLRRRYADLATRATDLVVSPDGYVLAGERLAAPEKPLAIPEGGGEILLGGGSSAVAEPLGHGEAYLVRRTDADGFGVAPTEMVERAKARRNAAARHADDHGIAVKAEGRRPGPGSDRRTRAYFEAALDCVIIADASGRIMEFNPAAERTFGYTRDEALGRTMAELIVPPSLRERHSTGFSRFIESRHERKLRRRVELTGMRADGSVFPVELSLSLVETEPVLIYGALRDISAAKQAESHLRELAEEQAALRRVATLVARESSPQQLLALVAEQVARIINVPLVRLVRYESDGSGAELIGGWGTSVDPLAIGARWPLDGPGVFAAVWQRGRAARLDDYEGVPGQAAAVVRQAGMRSAVACPIAVEGRLWGAIAVLSPRHEPLPEDTEARLADFTELVATAIANAESRTAIARLADEQAALRRVATLVADESSPEHLFAAVAEEVGRVLDLPVTALVCYEPDGSAIEIVGAWSESTSSLPTGTRLLLDGPSAVASVWQSGDPARTDETSDVPGEIAAFQRQAGLQSTIASPILVEGHLWGAMAAGSSERLPAGIESRLMEFTELVATAIANSEARAEVAASRARVIAAGDETRRRIERDLHDGAQQQLVTLALELRSAEAKVPAGLEDLRTEVGRFADRLTSVIDELREMARGIHPAVLTEGGLSPALEALALRSPVPVKLNVRCQSRLADGIEVAAYYVASEALTNAAKHADASVVQVDLHVGAGTLRLAIVDDGVGGAEPSEGSGLIGLKDRVEALGGTIDVASPPGSGTRLDVEIPLLPDSAVASNSEVLSRA